jgi:LAO/AO transport system kinase
VIERTGRAARVGITGVPGVGKSTFIERLGTMLTTGALGAPKRLAVLAIDPSSTVTGGSILGDKTRMARLTGDPNAFVRPSPSSGTLGGVAQRTRESMLLCEAAGYDVVFVETVGVGQSETTVAQMTDVFLALMLPGAGDELQGIKRGLLELADLVAVNKADGDNLRAARIAVAEHEAALRCMPTALDDHVARVLMCSAKTGDGVADVWRAIDERLAGMRTSGLLQTKRQSQRLGWMHQLIDESLRRAFERDGRVTALREAIERDVRAGDLPPSAGAQRLIDAFLRTDAP